MTLEAALLWLALNCYFEARSEDFSSQVAVANVVLNRVASSKYPNTIEEVVKQHKQFSWYWDGKSDKPKDKKAWKIAVQAASVALGGYNNVGDSLFYYNPRLADPHWATQKEFVTVSGNHVFLK